MLCVREIRVNRHEHGQSMNYYYYYCVFVLYKDKTDTNIPSFSNVVVVVALTQRDFFRRRSLSFKRFILIFLTRARHSSRKIV